MSIYNLQATRPNGEVVAFSEFKNKVVLIVNTASQCGFTPQYEQLQALHEKYTEQGLVVLGMPSNQFDGQNPEGSVETEAACKLNFGVTFPLFEVADMNGEAQHPVFAYLKEQVPYHTYVEGDKLETMLLKMFEKEMPHLLEGNVIRWNFTKFLVNRDGEVVKRFEPFESMDDVERAVVELLG